MDNKSNFVVSYSDDIAYHSILRENYLKTKPVDNFLFESYCCRILSILIIGNIETLLAEWESRIEEDNGIKLLNYLKAGTMQEIEINKKKITSIFDEIKVDEDILHDYLVIKNLRNAIVHSDMNKNKTSILDNSKFSANVHKLGAEEWDRLKIVNKGMMQMINEYFLKIHAIEKGYSNIFEDLESGMNDIVNTEVPMLVFMKIEEVFLLYQNYYLELNNPQKCKNLVSIILKAHPQL